MGKTTGRLLIAVVLLLAASNWFYARRAKAASQVGYGQAGCVSLVPREWGDYKGGSYQSGLAFQDNSGTLRFVTNVPCGATQVALEIRRTVSSN
jgi:hypothetical protein